jgi:hypothetical protein
LPLRPVFIIYQAQEFLHIPKARVVWYHLNPAGIRNQYLLTVYKLMQCTFETGSLKETEKS